MSVVRRKAVRDRASHCCEYCCLPDSAAGYPFHIEHILALKHGGSSGPDNLAWACVQCNGFKGSDIAGLDPDTNELTRLYHPRRDQWDAHFEIMDGYVIGKTPIGRATVALLRMNQPPMLAMRQALIETGQWQS